MRHETLHQRDATASQRETDPPYDVLRDAQNRVQKAYNYIQKDTKLVPDKDRLKKARDLWQEKIEEPLGKKGKDREETLSELLKRSYKAAKKEYEQRDMFLPWTRPDKLRLLHLLKKNLPVDRDTGSSQGLEEVEEEDEPYIEQQAPSWQQLPAQAWNTTPGNASNASGGFRVTGNEITYSTWQEKSKDLVEEQSPQNLRRALEQPHVRGLGPDIEKSDAGSVRQYNLLLRSAPFRELDRIVTSNEKISLFQIPRDSPQQPSYGAETHAIYLPCETHSITEAERRAYILWEMHNAVSRDAFLDLEKLQPSSSTPPEIARSMKAAYALANEWYEWVKIIEFRLRTEAINQDPGMKQAGLYVMRDFLGRYLEKEQGWYTFTNYLKAQMRQKSKLENSSHTAGYDPAAIEPDWVGKQILAVIQKEKPASLLITQAQVRDWQERRTTFIKSPSENPFTSPSLWESATEGNITEAGASSHN